MMCKNLKTLIDPFIDFPTIESFLGRGALMTGEASPGYMPYPSVVESVVKRLSPHWKPSGSDDNDVNGVKAWKVHVRALPKIIAIVRDPIDRAQSSYRYNYIEPALQQLKAGRGLTVSGKSIPGGNTEKYYRQHDLFSFEELVYEELGVLTATENGYGKRTPVGEYTRHGRGTKGMIAIQTSDRNGKLVGACLVEPTDEVMLISTGGVLIRTKVQDIRELGRATQGVTLINLDEGTYLAGIEKVAESESDDLVVEEAGLDVPESDGSSE